MAALFNLLAAVIGLAAGLGVSQRNLRSPKTNVTGATESPPAATTVFVTATPTAIGTTTPTTSSSSASATPVTFTITSPGLNNTMHTAETNSSLSPTSEGPGKQLHQFYGINFGGDQAVNVGSIRITSMDACIDAYAAHGAEHRPLTKANLTEPHNAAAKQAVRHPAQHVGHSRVPVHGG
ncbi:hypothetical protein FJTKL_14196 [Diaporthe vaccinii]|uniref:Uncharacterized protein n=1 Tax=Diaporthe vaccinii TaxID=105482 RepID=A0ABR4E8Q7_9PEZI